MKELSFSSNFFLIFRPFLPLPPSVVSIFHFFNQIETSNPQVCECVNKCLKDKSPYRIKQKINITYKIDEDELLLSIYYIPVPPACIFFIP
jgi:hypothetical protein